MKMKQLPSVDYLRECFTYDPLTGVLIWKIRPLEHFVDVRAMNTWNTRFASREAGTINQDGYRLVVINYRQYRTHRIISKMMTGEDPPEEIDHRNTQQSDNRWLNLREATRQQNNFNVGVHKDSKSGLKGASFHRSTQKFRAQIKIHDKNKYLGLFHTALEAHQAYCEAARELHGNFLNVGQPSHS